jgi:hypothetical protein
LSVAVLCGVDEELNNQSEISVSEACRSGGAWFSGQPLGIVQALRRLSGCAPQCSQTQNWDSVH